MTTHVGPYERLTAAYAALEEWMRAEGREYNGPSWEVYLSDPNAQPDPEQWVTEVFFPVR